MVINNFVIKIGSQIKDSLCRVFGDGVQYEWRENDDKVIIPDVSIICNLRDRKNISSVALDKTSITKRGMPVKEMFLRSLSIGSLTGEKNL